VGIKGEGVNLEKKEILSILYPRRKEREPQLWFSGKKKGGKEQEKTFL